MHVSRKEELIQIALNAEMSRQHPPEDTTVVCKRAEFGLNEFRIFDGTQTELHRQSQVFKKHIFGVSSAEHDAGADSPAEAWAG